MVRLTETTTIRAPVKRCFELARGVEVHLAGNVHFGAWQTFTNEIAVMGAPVAESAEWRWYLG